MASVAGPHVAVQKRHDTFASWLMTRLNRRFDMMERYCRRHLVRDMALTFRWPKFRSAS